MQQPAELFDCLCVCVKKILYVCLCVCTDSILRLDWEEHGEVLEVLEVLERAQGAYRAAHDDYDCECMNQGMHHISRSSYVGEVEERPADMTATSSG
jgi:hypothetical protein